MLRKYINHNIPKHHNNLVPNSLVPNNLVPNNLVPYNLVPMLAVTKEIMLC